MKTKMAFLSKRMAGLINRISNFESIILDTDPEGTFEYVFIISNSKVENDSGLIGEGGHHYLKTDSVPPNTLLTSYTCLRNPKLGSDLRLAVRCCSSIFSVRF